MHQFFIDSLQQIRLSPQQLHQCKHVLRMRQGDTVRMVDTSQHGAIVRFLSDDLDAYDVVQPLEWKPNPIRLRLIASLIRGERLEWMIQKACECGVDDIVLYRADRGVVRDYDQRTQRKLQRFNAIALEACEQAQRNKPVSISAIISKHELAPYLSQANYFADVRSDRHLINHLSSKQNSLSVLIGPEGGFTDDERQTFITLGIVPVSLGDCVLRAETASIYACNAVAVFKELQ